MFRIKYPSESIETLCYLISGTLPGLSDETAVSIMAGKGGVWVFYFIQGEDGESVENPNAFNVSCCPRYCSAGLLGGLVCCCVLLCCPV